MLTPSRVDKKGQRGLFYRRMSAESMAQTPLYRFSKQFLYEVGCINERRQEKSSAVSEPLHTFVRIYPQPHEFPT